MQKFKLIKIVFSLLLVSVFFVQISAQTSDYDYKLGVRAGNLFHSTEFKLSDGLVISPFARGFGRIELDKYLEGEAGIGIGMLNGKDFAKNEWNTRIIPVDFRLLFTPLNDQKWNPYIYAGVGLMTFENTQSPKSKSVKETKDNGLAGYVPFGVGVEIALSDYLLVDIGGGYTQSFTDNLNKYIGGNESNIAAFDGYYEASVGLTFVSAGSSDADKDGLTKKEEKAIGTDPEKADTDGDGIKDGDEVIKYKTDPLKPDTDGDGLVDYAEIMTYKTDPNKADTDGDGLTDAEEVDKFKTDPFKPDTDGDGLSDSDEIKVNKTNPLKSDSDGDGLLDKEEITLGTNPQKIDSDGDGLNDADEVKKYKTNPLIADTDGGSVNDFIEVHRGTNPLNAQDDEILEINENTPIILEGVTFQSGSAVIGTSSEVILIKALNTLNAYPDLRVEIRGYTDNTGSTIINNRLSQKRAESVKQWLVERGIAPTRVSAKGYGPSSPIADNSTKEGRAKNRRIEFYPLKK